MGTRVAAHEGRLGVGHVVEEGVGEPARRRHAERVAIQARVLGRDPPLLAGDPHAHGPALALELGEHRLGRVALRRARLALGRGEIPEPAQDLLERVAILGERVGVHQLERPLDLLQRLRIDQLAQLVGAEQLAEQVAVERQRRRPALGVGRVALVHVGRDVVEEQRGGERRRGLGLDLDQAHPARVQVAQQLGKRRQVEHVAQALAVGLEDDREAGEVLGDLEQVLGLQPLLPERRAPAGVGAGEQQAAGRVLAKAGAEQRRPAELANDQVLDLVRVEQHQVGVGRLVGVGQVNDDPVVGPDRIGLEVVLVADPGRECQPPGGVDATAEGREHAQAPIADLVAEALDDERLVGGHDAGRRLLFAQVGDQVGGGALVEVVLGGERCGVLADRLAREGADRPAELGGAADAVAAPEGHRARGSGRRRDDHPVAGDVLDPPGRRPEQEGLPRAGLVDHLLVELADPLAVGQVHPVQAAIGDRAGVGDRELARALAAAHRAGGPVPDHPRAQLGEALGRIAAVEHVEDVLELLARKLGERIAGGHEALDLVDLPLGVGDHRDQVLSEDVQRVARDHGLLDLAATHPARDHRALEQVAAELGEDAALRGLAELVAGAPDALQPARDRLRRLDLDHQVDGAHVDAELEAGGRDQARQLPGLEHLLDHETLFVGQ